MAKHILKILTLSLMMFIGNNVFAQGNMQDVIYLKNGSIIRGVIIEQIPNKSYKIQTADGSVFVYEVDKVEKITKEQLLNCKTDGVFIRVGINLMNYSGNDILDTKRKMGYSFTLGKRTNLYSDDRIFIVVYSPECSFRSRGYNSQSTFYSNSLMANGFQITPLNYSFSFILANNIFLDIHTGAYIAFDYLGKFTEKSDDYNIKRSISLNDIEKYIYGDAGINIGTGIWINGFNINFTFTKGFIRTIKGVDATNNNLIFSLGYKF